MHAVMWLDHFSVHLLQHEPQVHTDVIHKKKKERKNENELNVWRYRRNTNVTLVTVCMTAHQCNILNKTRDQVMIYFIVDCMSYLKTSSILKTFF